MNGHIIIIIVAYKAGYPLRKIGTCLGAHMVKGPRKSQEGFVIKVN